jgi:hypothetical protein
MTKLYGETIPLKCLGCNNYLMDAVEYNATFYLCSPLLMLKTGQARCYICGKVLCWDGNKRHRESLEHMRYMSHEPSNQAYQEVRLAVARSVLHVVQWELVEGERGRLALLQERGETLAALRRLCASLGGAGDWPDDLYLPDVIEKYLIDKGD